MGRYYWHCSGTRDGSTCGLGLSSTDPTAVGSICAVCAEAQGQIALPTGKLPEPGDRPVSKGTGRAS